MSTSMPKLTPTRATMLRLVRYSEITVRYDSDQLAGKRVTCTDTGPAGKGEIGGMEAQALIWLEERGMIRLLEPDSDGNQVFTPTSLGHEWLAANRVLG